MTKIKIMSKYKVNIKNLFQTQKFIFYNYDDPDGTNQFITEQTLMYGKLQQLHFSYPNLGILYQIGNEYGLFSKLNLDSMKFDTITLVNNYKNNKSQLYSDPLVGMLPFTISNLSETIDTYEKFTITISSSDSTVSYYYLYSFYPSKTGSNYHIFSTNSISALPISVYQFFQIIVKSASGIYYLSTIYNLSSTSNNTSAFDVSLPNFTTMVNYQYNTLLEYNIDTQLNSIQFPLNISSNISYNEPADPNYVYLDQDNVYVFGNIMGIRTIFIGDINSICYFNMIDYPTYYTSNQFDVYNNQFVTKEFYGPTKFLLYDTDTTYEYGIQECTFSESKETGYVSCLIYFNTNSNSTNQMKVTINMPTFYTIYKLFEINSNTNIISVQTDGSCPENTTVLGEYCVYNDFIVLNITNGTSVNIDYLYYYNFDDTGNSLTNVFLNLGSNQTTTITLMYKNIEMIGYYNNQYGLFQIVNFINVNKIYNINLTTTSNQFAYYNVVSSSDLTNVYYIPKNINNYISTTQIQNYIKMGNDTYYLYVNNTGLEQLISPTFVITNNSNVDLNLYISNYDSVNEVYDSYFDLLSTTDTISYNFKYRWLQIIYKKSSSKSKIYGLFSICDLTDTLTTGANIILNLSAATSYDPIILTTGTNNLYVVSNNISSFVTNDTYKTCPHPIGTKDDFVCVNETNLVNKYRNITPDNTSSSETVRWFLIFFLVFAIIVIIAIVSFAILYNSKKESK